MKNYIQSSDSVTEANKEEVVLSIIDHLSSKCDNNAGRDIFIAVAVATKVDLKSIDGIYNFNYSAETFTGLPEATRIRYLADVCVFLLINDIWLHNEKKPTDTDIEYTVSRVELKDLANILKAQQDRISKNSPSLAIPVKPLNGSIGDYNASLVIQYLLDITRGTSSKDKSREKLDKIFRDIVEGDYCIFLKDVKRVDCKLDNLDDYVRLTSHIISKCIFANSEYTINKLASICDRLPETLPVPVVSETYTSIGVELRDTFFAEGSETTDLAVKICIVILNNLVSKSSDYVAMDTILNM